MPALAPVDQRFVSLAMNSGWVTNEQVRACVDKQRRLKHEGTLLSMQELMVQDGLLSASQGQALQKCIKIERDERIAAERLVEAPDPEDDDEEHTEAAAGQKDETAAVAVEEAPASESEPDDSTAASVPENGKAAYLSNDDVSSDGEGPAPSESTATEADTEFVSTDTASVETPPSPSDLEMPAMGKVDEAAATLVDPGSPRAQAAPRIQQMPKRIGGYRIDAEVGAGRSGTVYRAYQESMDRVVALKVLSSGVRDQNFVEQFLSEARAAGRLNHPNLIRVHDVGEQDGFHYYSMEWVEGSTFDRLLEQAPLDLLRVVTIMLQVAQALDYGHRHDLLHGAVRPTNIIVNAEDRDVTKLAELGLSQPVAQRYHTAQTARYAAPELTPETIDIRTDLYRVGAIFYHAATGGPVFDGEVAEDILRHHAITPPADPRRRNAMIPERLANVLLRLLKKDPAERYQSPGELVPELRELHEELLRNPPAPPRSRRRGRRKKKVLRKGRMRAGKRLAQKKAGARAGGRRVRRRRKLVSSSGKRVLTRKRRARRRRRS
jgi:hypothetical protein